MSLDYQSPGSDDGLLAREWLWLWSLYLLACVLAWVVLTIFVASADDENAFHWRISFGFLAFLVFVTLTAIVLTLGGGRRLILWWRAGGERRTHAVNGRRRARLPFDGWA